LSQALEDEILNGQKIPDWHNIKEVHRFLVARDAVDEFPLLKKIYEVAYDGAEAEGIVTVSNPHLIRT